MEKADRIRGLAEQTALRAMSVDWLSQVSQHKYCYNFSWLGRPVIQFPQDIVAIQELVWQIKPEAVVETGVAHGGSLVLSASCLEVLGGEGRVLGIDIDIRPHNRRAIEAHPLSHRIELLEGSSIDERLFARVEQFCRGRRRVLVILDSNHTHEHVLRELELYSRLVRQGSYLVVMDTIIEDMPADSFPDRPWSRGNNPKTAVREFLQSNRRFEIDRELEAKLQITVAPDGWLRCLADPQAGEDLS